MSTQQQAISLDDQSTEFVVEIANLVQEAPSEVLTAMLAYVKYTVTQQDLTEFLQGFFTEKRKDNSN